MNGRKYSILKSVLSVFLVLLLVVLAVGVLFKYTDLKDINNTEFRVEYNGKKYYKSDTDYVVELPSSGQVKFSVKGCDSYKFKFSTNVSDTTDFSYSVDGKKYNFSTADITSAFLQGEYIQNGDFIVSCFNDYSIKNVLSKIYDGNIDVDNVELDNPYRLTFLNLNDEAINFIFGGSFMAEIELDITEIIF